jgi:antitoxin ParD1/3/4
MATGIPTEMSPFVDRMLAEKRFHTEGEVVLAGLRLLEARETLREDLKLGLDELNAGLVLEEEDVFAEVEKAIRQVENGEV